MSDKRKDFARIIAFFIALIFLATSLGLIAAILTR